MIRQPRAPVYVLSTSLPGKTTVASTVAEAGGHAEVRLPFPAQEMHDYQAVADHFLAAAFVGERLARHCASVDGWEDVSGGSYSTYLGAGHGAYAVFTCVVTDPEGFAVAIDELAPLAPDEAVRSDSTALNADEDDEDDEDDEERAFARSELLLEAYDEITALVDARDVAGARRPACPEFVNWAFVYLPSTEEAAEDTDERPDCWPGYAEGDFVPYPDAMGSRTAPRERPT